MTLEDGLFPIDFIGYCYDIAGSDVGAKDGPTAFFSFLKKDISFNQSMVPILVYQDQIKKRPNKTEMIADALTALHNAVANSIKSDRLFTVIGGDHSCGIGTWSAALNALNEPFSLIWIDAHMDAHTTETSPSQNVHGMSVANLLGFRDSSLSNIVHHHSVIHPENLYIIGVRSYEPEEIALLNQMGVKIYFMDEVTNRGFLTVFKEALECSYQKTQKIGISIDIDAFDSTQMPGTDIHVDEGICVKQFLEAINCIRIEGLIGLEIAEYNPHKDIEHKTAQNMANIIKHIF